MYLTCVDFEALIKKKVPSETKKYYLNEWKIYKIYTVKKT